MSSANNPPVAIYYLERENDNNNRCLLTENALIITRKGKTTQYSTSEIALLSINRRKMMLPLIVGGIFSPLSIIAIAKNLFVPWAILSWLMLNLILFYFGWQGYNVLTVELHGLHHDFPIKVRGNNLVAFVDFVNEYVRQPSGKPPRVSALYHILPEKEWISAQKEGQYTPTSLLKEGFIHLSTHEQLPLVRERYFQHQANLVLLHIDPLKVTATLRFESVYPNEAPYPHLYGALNWDAVIKVEHTSSPVA